MKEKTEKKVPVVGKSRRRKRRWLRWLAVPFLAVLALLAGIVFLLTTQTGFRFLLGSADYLAGELFSVQEVQGRFIDAWQLNRVSVQLDNGLNLTLAEVKWDWNAAALRNRTVQLNQFKVQGMELHLPAAGEEADSDSPFTLPEIALPVDLQLKDVQLQEAKIYFADSSEPFIINTVLLQAVSQGNQIVVDRLLFDSPDYGTDLAAGVQLQGDWPLHINGSWRLADPGIGDMTGSLQAEGDLNSLQIRLGLKTPAVVRLNGQLTDILNDLHWQAAAETDHFHLNDIKVDVPVDGTLRISEAAGTIENYSGTLAATVQYQGYPKVEAQAKVAGDYSGLTVDYLRILLNDTRLSTHGRMDWADSFTWQAELAGEQVDPALFAADWPGRINFVLQSRGTLGDSGQQLTVELESLEGVLREFPLNSSGTVSLDNGTVAIENFRIKSGDSSIRLSGTAAETVELNLQAELADLSSLVPEAGGRVQLQGTVKGSRSNPALNITLEGKGLKLEEYAVEQLQATLNADLSLDEADSGLDIHALDIVLNEQAKLQATGQVGWSGGVSWQLTLEGKDLDPALFAPDWPGTISTSLTSSGRLAGDELKADLGIEQLGGDLRGFPLSGSGSAAFVDNTLTLADLRLQSGSSQVQINGRAGNALDLSFTAESSDLASLLPGAAGIFQLQGTAGGSREQPQLALTLDGSGLALDSYRLEKLQVGIKADLAANGTIEAALTAGGIEVAKEQISKVELQLMGNLAKHQLDLSIAGSPGDLQLVLAGGMEDDQWQGQLSRLEAETGQFGSWQIVDPVAVMLAKTGCALSGFKLVQNQAQQQGTVTLDGKWQQEEGWQVAAGLADFSLARLEEWGLPVPVMTGQLGAAVTARGKGAVPDRLDLSVSLPELTLITGDEDAESDDATVSWQWTDNTVKVQLENGNGELTAHTLFQDGSEASLAVKLKDSSGFTDPAAIVLDGGLDINLKDLKPLAPISNYMVQAKGEFGGTVTIQGTAANPSLNGRMALKDGEIVIPVAGLALHELELAVTGDTTANRMTLTIASGEGTVKVAGAVSQDPQHHWQADFTIKGEEFKAVDLTEYQVLISPDLRLVYGAGGTSLSGRVTVPEAHIAPTGFAGSVSSSGDVVVVDGEGEPEKKKLPLSMNLELVMGDQVVVDAFGVQGFLEGRLQVRQKPGQAITGVGSLNLRDGVFAIKNSQVKISRGRVFYQGGSIENPGLDVQADKTVDDVEVGIRLTGQVDSMEMTLFSSPPMEDSEILSYLLTGKDMNSSDDDSSMLGTAAATLGRAGGGALLDNVEKGTGLDLSLGGGEKATDVSLVVGKRVHKNLYISYGKGLTGEASKFKARYDLKYGFSVETEASSEATGTDIRWSTER